MSPAEGGGHEVKDARSGTYILEKERENVLGTGQLGQDDVAQSLQRRFPVGTTVRVWVGGAGMSF